MKPADGRHLSDDQMIAVYVGAEPRFGRRTTALGHHLQGCAGCARRFEAFAQQMAGLRDDAVAEADDVFTPARLEAQRQQILARLEHAAHPARVIPFPSPGAVNLSIFTGSQMRRWIAVAAAAGLILGVPLGRTLDIVWPGHHESRVTPPPTSRPAPAPTQPAHDPTTEEEILSRVEQAQGDLQVPAELEALDRITPISEVALRLPPRR